MTYVILDQAGFKQPTSQALVPTMRSIILRLFALLETHSRLGLQESRDGGGGRAPASTRANALQADAMDPDSPPPPQGARARSTRQESAGLRQREKRV